MRSARCDSVEKLIRACLDGELAAAETEDVRNHCDECPDCARVWDELAAYAALLPPDSRDRPTRPLWPAVRSRLAGRSPWLSGRRFALSASAAALAGLLLGAQLGGGISGERGESATTSFPSLESVWTEESAPTLADVYLADLTNGSE